MGGYEIELQLVCVHVCNIMDFAMQYKYQDIAGVPSLGTDILYCAIY